MQKVHKTPNSPAVYKRVKIDRIKYRYISGQMLREQAKLEANPVIKRVDTKQQESATKHDKNGYPLVTFTGIIR